MQIRGPLKLYKREKLLLQLKWNTTLSQKFQKYNTYQQDKINILPYKKQVIVLVEICWSDVQLQNRKILSHLT